MALLRNAKKTRENVMGHRRELDFYLKKNIAFELIFLKTTCENIDAQAFFALVQVF